MKKIVSLIIGIILIMNCFPTSSFASGDEDASGGADSVVNEYENTNSLEINAKSAVLMDAETGTVLYMKDAAESLPPASVTKIMTLLLVMEAIETGKLDFDTEVTASEHACSMGGSQIWLEPGEIFTVHELLKAAAIASAAV